MGGPLQQLRDLPNDPCTYLFREASKNLFELIENDGGRFQSVVQAIQQGLEGGISWACDNNRPVITAGNITGSQARNQPRLDQR